MVKKMEIALYTVDELEGKAKEKALEWGRECLNQTFDGEEFTHQLQEYARENHGVKTETCYWSLGYCQGDGVAFYGALDLEELGKKNVAIQHILNSLSEIDNTPAVYIHGEDGRYHHYNSMCPLAEVDDGHHFSERNFQLSIEELDKRADALRGNLEKEVKDILEKASRATERYGYSVLEADREDEAVEDFLQGNEYTFLENGKRFEPNEN